MKTVGLTFPAAEPVPAEPIPPAPIAPAEPIPPAPIAPAEPEEAPSDTAKAKVKK